MACVNVIWAGNFFQMQVNPARTGPDLQDAAKYAEVKFGQTDENWTLVGKKQINYGKLDRPCYLIAGLHFFNTPLSRFSVFSQQIFENNVHSRAIWIAPWTYIDSLKIHGGRKNDYVYPRMSDLNIVEAYSYPKEKTAVYFTKGTNPKEWLSHIPKSRKRL